MTKKIILAIITICTLSMSAQSQSFVRELDQKTNRPLLRGQITFADLLNETEYGWMVGGYDTDMDVAKKLKELLPKYHLVVFGGTWCEDTQAILPQLYQTLKDASFDFNALEMYGVNRAKEGLNAEHKIYNIERVPTIIVMDRFREVGRITESLNDTIEKDLLNILDGDQ